MANFRIIDGEAPGLLQRRVVRLGAWGAAMFVLAPALLLVGFGMFVLIDWFITIEGSPALDTMPTRDRLVGLAVMAALAVPLLALGRKFVLGRRRIVLFLRRFGDKEALATVTQAAVGASGSGYRLVTLDDRSAAGAPGERHTLTVADDPSLEVALTRVRRLSRRLLAPRTVFLEVDDRIWRNVVLRLVAETNAVLIDVSEPGPSLLWEIETVGAMVRPRWILVGEGQALIDLARLDMNDEPTSVSTLAGLLQGEEVLAYRSGQHGGRFAMALRARYDLVTRHGAVPRSGAPAADTSMHDLAAGEPADPPPYDLEGPPAPWWPGRTAGLPPEGPGSLASAGERLAARGIDMAVGSLILLILAGLEAAARAATSLPESEGDWLRTLFGAAVLVAVLAYDPCSTLLLGATPGKRFLRLRVVQAVNREPATVRVVAARGLVQVALWLCCVVPGILDALTGLSDPLRQTWHDRAAQTLVVHAPTRRSPPDIEKL